MELIIEPAEDLVDRLPELRVTGLDPSAAGPAMLTVTTTDAAGHGWRSTEHCEVDSDGTVRLPDPSRPWWAMAFTATEVASVAFTAAPDSLEYGVDLHTTTTNIGTRIRRFWGRNLVAGPELAGSGWRMTSYRPTDRTTPGPAVLVVPGFTGGAAVKPTAALLASHGYLTAVLSYLGEAGLPETFADIDVGVITNGLQALAELPEVDPARIAVHCLSVGTGLVLSALSDEDHPPVAAAIAVAPTSVVWQSLSAGGPPPKSSSLRRAGKSLPYVPLRGDKLLGQLVGHALRRLLPGPHSSALAMRHAYEAGLRDSKAAADAAIPIERCTAPLLLIAGDQDAVWPAEQMARDLIKRRGARADDRLLVLPGAGHFLRPPIIPTTVSRTDGLEGGGTPEANARGARFAWDTTLAFLHTHLNEAS